jgi:hypothetical protein
MYPLCRLHEIQNFPKKPKLAKKANFFKKAKKQPTKPNFQKKAKIIQNLAFCQILAFLEIFVFFGNKNCIFWNKFAVCHFGGYIRTT